MKNNYVYPNQYELMEVFSSITNRQFLNEFAQNKGIFITKSTRDDLAKELSLLFYDNEDLEIIRNEAFNSNANHALNGFTINSSNKRFDLSKAYDSIRQNGKDIKNYIFSALVQKEDYLKGTIQYSKHKPGRIEFLQQEDIAFDFYLKKNIAGEWQVEVDGNKSTDVKELKQIFLKNLGTTETITTIEQERLDPIKLITFFDQLGEKGMGDEWKAKDIKHITVRKGREEESKTKDEDEEEDTIVLEDEERIQIKQAILEGKQLRENEFVKKFETDGYKFTAMTYEFEHKTQPNIIQIKAEFKGKPKTFEVQIKSYDKYSGIPSNRETEHLTLTQNRNIRSLFWNNAKAIYDKL